MTPRCISSFNELEGRKPAYALAVDVDLVVTRCDEQTSVLAAARIADDLTSFKTDTCRLTDVAYGGISADNRETL